MRIVVEKLTGFRHLARAAETTSGRTVCVDSIERAIAWYKSEHSPIRTQLFWIDILDIPTMVSVHLVRHHVGVEHFVKTNRRHGEMIPDRYTPVNHSMLINAQALINISRKRLCSKAATETRIVWASVKAEVASVDHALALCMVPDCEYRGKCHEMQKCGDKNGITRTEGTGN